MNADLITLRDAAAEDLSFLARLYADTRRHEVGSWGWPREQQESFLRMQFDAQRMSYKAGFPDAQDRIVLQKGAPVGRLLVSRNAASVRLIDIALLEAHRQQGIGTYLMGKLLEECAARGRALRLQVMQGNRAMRLYRRLGFVQAGGDAIYVQMEWKPLPQPKVAAS